MNATSSAVNGGAPTSDRPAPPRRAGGRGGSGAGANAAAAASVAATPGGYDFARDGGDTPQRNTATFEPYYWDAYNEIVQPRRFDHYLVRRWLPELGPLGFSIVKALRDRCYHDPRTGVLRDACEVDMEELASTLGTSRSSLFREFGRNEALGQFVRRVRQYQMVDGKPRQDKNLYQISMDDPVHPIDAERYEALRAEKERERQGGGAGTGPNGLPTHVVKGLTTARAAKPYGSQSDTHRGTAYGSQIETQTSAKVAYESQIDTADTKCLGSQNATPDTTCPGSHSDTAVVNLPSGGGLPTDRDTPGPTELRSVPGRAGSPPINPPPGGEKDLTADEAVWAGALALLEVRVNKPTFEAHLRTLRPLGRPDGTGAFTLACPSLFTREWLDKRHRAAIEEAVSECLGEEVTVCLTV